MRRTIAAVLGMSVLAGASVLAHHGYANFVDPAVKTATIEGDLEGLRYANPHVVMMIRTADSTLYAVTWQSAFWVRQFAHVTPTTFKVGDHLVVTAAPSLDPASHDLARVREVRRPRDGWTWRDSQPFAEPSRWERSSNP